MHEYDIEFEEQMIDEGRDIDEEMFDTSPFEEDPYNDYSRTEMTALKERYYEE